MLVTMSSLTALQFLSEWTPHSLTLFTVCHIMCFILSFTYYTSYINCLLSLSFSLSLSLPPPPLSLSLKNYEERQAEARMKRQQAKQDEKDKDKKKDDKPRKRSRSRSPGKKSSRPKSPKKPRYCDANFGMVLIRIITQEQVTGEKG